jgi:hypothetical protein
MRVSLTFDGCTTEELRAILAACSRNRESFPPVSLHSTSSWLPQVRCDGPNHYGVVVAPVNQETARAILSAASIPVPAPTA